MNMDGNTGNLLLNMENKHYTVDMHIDDIRVLYKSVCFHLEKWPGGDPAEQEHLFYMKDWLYRMVLDYQFHEPDSPH